MNGVQDYSTVTSEAARTTTCTILDDGDAGTFSFSPTAYQIHEAEDKVWLNITITRMNREHPSGMITVKYATVAGTAKPGDYEDVANGVALFGDGENVRHIAVGIQPDDDFEVGAACGIAASHNHALLCSQFPDEIFEVVITGVQYSPTHSSLGAAYVDSQRQSATVTILDDGDAGTFVVRAELEQLKRARLTRGPQFSNSSVQRAEPASACTFETTHVTLTITRMKSTSGSIVVHYQTSTRPPERCR